MKTCPNCGELVGDEVEKCFNCKFSFRYKRVIKEGDNITVQDMVNEINSGLRSTTLFDELIDSIEKGNYDGAILSIQNCYYCDIEMATNILALFKEQFYYEYEKMIKEARARALARGVGTSSNYVPNEPKCPTCGSTLVKRLSALSRGASVAVWGATSNKFNKSFECKNCGYTW